MRGGRSGEGRGGEEVMMEFSEGREWRGLKRKGKSDNRGKERGV